MGNTCSTTTKSTTTTTTIPVRTTNVTTTKTTTTTKTQSNEIKENDQSAVQDPVKLSANRDRCKAELKQLLGECSTDKNLNASVVNFFESCREDIESNAGTVAIAGALGLSMLETLSGFGIQKLSIMSIIGGVSIAAAAVCASFSGIVIVATGCLLFRKYRIMKKSREIKIQVQEKLNKLRKDMMALLEDCNENDFFQISKERFNNLRKQIDDLNVILLNIVKELQKQKKQISTAKKWIVGLSSVAIVAGVILCFTGFGAAIGAGLIVGGVVGFACAYKLYQAQKELEREIEFYRNTWKCIKDLEFILDKLETLQKTKLVNTKEKFENKIKYLKEFNIDLYDNYLKRLEQNGLLQDYACEIYVPDPKDKQETIKDKEKEFKELFSDLEGKHENHLWVIVKGWVKEYNKIKSLFDTIFDEREKNVAYNKKKRSDLQSVKC